MYIGSKLTAGIVGLAALATAAAAPLALAKDTNARVMVNIGHNGKVEVHGAQVTAVSGDQITATTTWGDTTLTWTVEAASTTTMKDKSGKKGGKGKYKSVATSDIVVGNVIDFNGVLDTDRTGLHVDARVIHNKSFKVAPQTNAKGYFQGVLETIASTTLPTTLGIQVGSTDYTVNVGTTTKILDEDSKTSVLADFSVGDTLRVTGSANASNTIDARQIRNLTR